MVSIVGDVGEPYRGTYYDDGWVAAMGRHLARPLSDLERFTTTGTWEAATQE